MPVAQQGPDDPFARVTKFILGADQIIAGEDSFGTWPDFAKALSFAPSTNTWKVKDLPVDETRFSIDVQDWRGDKQFLGGKGYFVHWRAEKQRNACVYGTTITRSSTIWVNGLSRTTPSSCYGGCVYLPTSGEFNGQLLVLAVTLVSTNLRVQRALYSDFLLGNPTWTQLTIAGDLWLGDEAGTIPSIYFSPDGKKGSYVNALGENNTWANSAVDVEITIDEEGKTSTGVRTIHGPFDRTYSKDVSVGLSSGTTIYTDSQGDDLSYGVGDLADGFFKQSTDFTYPIGADYDSDLNRVFVELHYSENITETFSFDNIQLSDSGVTGTPSSPSDTLDVTASARVDTQTAYTGHRMFVDLKIGGVVVARVAERIYTGNYNVEGRGTDYETTLTARDLDEPPQGTNLEWDVPPVNGWTNGSSTTVNGTIVNTLNYRKESMGILLLVDARFNVACYGLADIKSGGFDLTSIIPSGPQYTDLYYAHDNVGNQVEIMNTVASTLPGDWRPAADVTTDTNTSTAQLQLGFTSGVATQDVDVELQYLYDIGTAPTRYSEVVVETETLMATAHEKRGLVVQLEQGTQARTETDLTKTTYATGAEDLPDLLVGTDFSNSTNSWRAKV